ncbi:MAG: hypothetical protein GY874_14620 [Desulfobacteraceae bacterium]|nr:hypothetical protein [Desulfobacteraceae bacterium]
MDNQEKKMAAAMAAVATYMQQEQEAGLEAMAAAQPLAGAPMALNLWGLSGRQSMMQLRNLMQMKALHGIR